MAATVPPHPAKRSAKRLIPLPPAAPGEESKLFREQQRSAPSSPNPPFGYSRPPPTPSTFPSSIDGLQSMPSDAYRARREPQTPEQSAGLSSPGAPAAPNARHRRGGAMLRASSTANLERRGSRGRCRSPSGQRSHPTPPAPHTAARLPPGAHASAAAHRPDGLLPSRDALPHSSETS